MIRPLLVILRRLVPGSEVVTGFTNFCELDGGLTRSAQLTGRQLEKIINQYGVRSFVSLRPPRPEKKWYNEEVRVCKEASIPYVHLGVDGTRLPSKEEILSMIKVAKEYPKPMHVQCKDGADRTSLFAGIYELVVNEETIAGASKQASLYFGNFVPYQRKFFKILKEEYINSNLEEWIKKEYNPKISN